MEEWIDGLINWLTNHLHLLSLEPEKGNWHIKPVFHSGLCQELSYIISLNHRSNVARMHYYCPFVNLKKVGFVHLLWNLGKLTLRHKNDASQSRSSTYICWMQDIKITFEYLEKEVVDLAANMVFLETNTTKSIYFLFGLGSRQVCERNTVGSVPGFHQSYSHGHWKYRLWIRWRYVVCIMT